MMALSPTRDWSIKWPQRSTRRSTSRKAAAPPTPSMSTRSSWCLEFHSMDTTPESINS
ncbi:unnamed protein product [Timema podura]|uniref:Uncharacterized protein n=1 Tax=Timema podura TaxID=61482 RepID=A0ABN7PNY6_TIMPD|nr:unnamed protein product [Timema podura]